MKVALVHYHLRTGGVTRVIAAQSEALTAMKIDHLVLSAGPIDAEIPCSIVPALDYTRESLHSPADLFRQLSAVFRRHFGSDPDLWHLHNPTLGKNILFPGLVETIAESKTPLLLHLHDLAEDNRPANYPLLNQNRIYPLAPQIHYATINRRDEESLKQAGLGNVHLLPNAIRPPHVAPEGGRRERLVFYPVRAIRRKNLGEAVLLAALAPAGTRFAIALAPDNASWMPFYNRWRDFAEKYKIPVEFDVVDKVPPAPGLGTAYGDWLERSTHLLTTSIAEGFGLAFLEPAALGKPLIGRDLPEITRDFAGQGITPGRLYDRIAIPLEELDAISLRKEFENSLRTNFDAYGRNLSDAEIDDAWKHLTPDDSIDFGNLPEAFQERLILGALRHPGDAGAAHANLRRWLHGVLETDKPTVLPGQLAGYSVESHRIRLAGIYRTILTAPRESPSWLPKEQVLAQYLHPHRFHFLRN